ncbi:multiple epidermal growth factor domains protein 10-like, partial [Tropilaelaps mercedesae]
VLPTTSAALIKGGGERLSSAGGPAWLLWCYKYYYYDNSHSDTDKTSMKASSLRSFGAWFIQLMSITTNIINTAVPALLVVIHFDGELPTSWALESKAPNVCIKHERYLANETIAFRKPYQVRTYTWCFAVPPRCSKYRTDYTTAYKQVQRERIRNVPTCCKGYVESSDGERCIRFDNQSVDLLLDLLGLHLDSYLYFMSVNVRMEKRYAATHVFMARAQDLKPAIVYLAMEVPPAISHVLRACGVSNASVSVRAETVRGATRLQEHAPASLVGRVTTAIKSVTTVHTGTHGDGCSSQCQCQNGGSCNPISGNCFCLEGWTGAVCAVPCPSGFYGPDCKLRCPCYNDALCDHITGRCHCPPGYTGSRCQDECSPGSFGLNCSKTCDCLNGASCDVTNGHCVCAPGFVGPRCETRKCSDGLYGKNCDLLCQCHAKNTKL